MGEIHSGNKVVLQMNILKKAVCLWSRIPWTGFHLSMAKGDTTICPAFCYGEDMCYHMWKGLCATEYFDVLIVNFNKRIIQNY